MRMRQEIKVMDDGDETGPTNNENINRRLQQ